MIPIIQKRLSLVCVFDKSDRECGSGVEYTSKLPSKDLEISSGFQYFFTHNPTEYIKMKDSDSGYFEIKSQNFNIIPIDFGQNEWNVSIWNSTVNLSQYDFYNVKANLYNSSFITNENCPILGEITVDYLSAIKENKILAPKLYFPLDCLPSEGDIIIKPCFLLCIFINIPTNVTFTCTYKGITITEDKRTVLISGLLRFNANLYSVETTFNLFTIDYLGYVINAINSNLYFVGSYSVQSIDLNIDKQSKLFFNPQSVPYLNIKSAEINIYDQPLKLYKLSAENDFTMNLHNPVSEEMEIKYYSSDKKMKIVSDKNITIKLQHIQKYKTINIEGAFVNLESHHDLTNVNIEKAILHDFEMKVDGRCEYIFGEVYGTFRVNISKIDFDKVYEVFEAKEMNGNMTLVNELPLGYTVRSEFREGKFKVWFECEKKEWAVCLSLEESKCGRGYTWYDNITEFMDKYEKEWKYHNITIQTFIDSSDDITLSLKGMEYICLEGGKFYITDIDSAKEISFFNTQISCNPGTKINCNSLSLKNTELINIELGDIRHINLYEISILFFCKDYCNYNGIDDYQISTKTISVYDSICEIYQFDLKTVPNISLFNCSANYYPNDENCSLNISAFDTKFNLINKFKLTWEFKFLEAKNVSYSEKPTNVVVHIDKFPNGIEYTNEQVMVKGSTILEEVYGEYDNKYEERFFNMCFQDLTLMQDSLNGTRVSERIRFSVHPKGFVIYADDFVSYQRPEIIFDEYSFMDPSYVKVYSLSAKIAKVIVKNFTFGEAYSNSQRLDQYQPFICTNIPNLKDYFFDFPNVDEGYIDTKIGMYESSSDQCLFIAWFNDSVNNENINVEKTPWSIFSSFSLFFSIALFVILLVLFFKIEKRSKMKDVPLLNANEGETYKLETCAVFTKYQ